MLSHSLWTVCFTEYSPEKIQIKVHLQNSPKMDLIALNLIKEDNSTHT